MFSQREHTRLKRGRGLGKSNRARSFERNFQTTQAGGGSEGKQKRGETGALRKYESKLSDLKKRGGGEVKKNTKEYPFREQAPPKRRHHLSTCNNKGKKSGRK